MDLNKYNLWTALITPMLKNGDVDYESLDKVLIEQERANNGILVLGSTGESLNIDIDERKKILNFVISKKMNVPIMVGVGGINLRETLEWVKYLEASPVDCYLLVTPLYAKPGTVGQYEWFNSLLDAANRPCMLYNIPGRTGVDLSKDAYAKLKNHKNLWALKEASGSIESFKEFVEIAPNVKVFSGDDGLTYEFSKVGCKGLVSVASNVWPTETNKYLELCLNRKLSETDAKMWEECADSLFVVSNPIPVKKLMFNKDMISSPILRAPLTHRELISDTALYESDKKVRKWYDHL